MYERNAIVLERYFNQMFGYDMKNNIKENFKNYCELIEALQNYTNTTEDEEEAMIQYDSIANKIREIQKKQALLNKKNKKYQQDRENIFETIDEDANLIQKKIDDINKNLQTVEEEIRENAQDFVAIIAEFNEKSSIRTQYGKSRRKVEIEYNRILNKTLDNYKNIDINLANKAKQFIERDTKSIEEELKTKIKKNGEKEKVQFSDQIIEQAIILSIDIQKRETNILSGIYEKTAKLFADIKNNSVKIDKYKKNIIDSKSKMNFIEAIKEYLIKFLDNERMASVNGEEEYNSLMIEACKNLNNDLVQINNLYALLIKEIQKKATKKMYNDLYKVEYLNDLEKSAEDFDAQVKKLKIPVAVINPNYWRIEKKKKIYGIFNKTVTDIYNRDLTEFIPMEMKSENKKDDETNDENDNRKETSRTKNSRTSKKVIQEDIEDVNEDEDENKDEELKSEIDEKIDIILGITKPNYKTEGKKKNKRVDDEEDDDWNNDLEEEDDDDEDLDIDLEDEEVDDDFEEDDDEYLDEDFENDDDEYLDDDYEENDDFEDEESDSDFEDEDIDEDFSIDTDEDIDNDFNDEYEDQYDELEEDDYNKTTSLKHKSKSNSYRNDDDIDIDIWGNNITKTNRGETEESDWGNEFIKINKKDTKKKKGFFEKFKK